MSELGAHGQILNYLEYWAATSFLIISILGIWNCISLSTTVAQVTGFGKRSFVGVALIAAHLTWTSLASDGQ